MSLKQSTLLEGFINHDFRTKNSPMTTFPPNNRSIMGNRRPDSTALFDRSFTHAPNAPVKRALAHPGVGTLGPSNVDVKNALGINPSGDGRIGIIQPGPARLKN